jgi:hypothetical protein
LRRAYNGVGRALVALVRQILAISASVYENLKAARALRRHFRYRHDVASKGVFRGVR